MLNLNSFSELYKNSAWTQQIEVLDHGLFVVPTPIGHMEDISIRALITLNVVDFILCENTRVTAILLNHYGIQTKCISYHQHNENEKLEHILHLMRTQRVALVSDRGTPGISDAGIVLIAACYNERIPVHIIPGSCSVIQGFLSAGFIENRFMFYGFLPRKTGAQRKIFESLKTLSAALIFFESPYRVRQTLITMETIFESRRVCIARELTKRFENVQRGAFSEIIKYYEIHPPLGECIIVVERSHS